MPRPIRVEVGNAKVTDWFFSMGTTPQPGQTFDCVSALITLFTQAQKTIHFAIYTFTHMRIADALIAAKQRGVAVEGVCDATQLKAVKSMAVLVAKLQAAGIPVLPAKRQKAIMHNKIAIVDNHYIASGSFNWTSSASMRNDENMLIVHGEQAAQMVEQYVYQRIKTKETLQEIQGK